MPRKKKKQNNTPDKSESEPKSKQGQCAECAKKGLQVKLSIRNHEVDRDGRITADIFECTKCQSWISVPRVESTIDEKARLRARLAELGGE